MATATPLRTDVDLSMVEIVDKIVQGSRPAIRRALLDAFANAREIFRQSVASVGFAAAVDDPRVWAMFAQTVATLYALDGPLFDLMVAGALKTAGSVGFAWTVDDPLFKAAAESYLRQESSVLVTQVGESTRNALRQVLTIEKSLPKVARSLMELPGLGLDAQQMKRFRGWIADQVATAESDNWSARRFQQVVDREFKRQLRIRANRIAITEGRNAGAASQDLALRRAFESGDIPTESALEWVARMVVACPVCHALDGARRAVHGGLFVSQPIASGKYAGMRVSFSRPTAHPGCLCGMRLVLPS